MKYPFLFVVQTNHPEGFPKTLEGAKYFVKIAKSFDLTSYNSDWMDDKDFPKSDNLGSFTLIPDLDLLESTHEFTSELDALRFIQRWWSEQILK